MGFDARKAVQPLDWNFEPWAGKGTVPDPTFEEQVEFTDDLAHAFGFTPGTMDEAGLAAATNALVQKVAQDDDPAGQMQAIFDRIYGAIAKLTKGSPSAEDLRAIPPRVLFAFLGWLFGEINPLGETPAPAPGQRMTPTLAAQRGGAPTS